MPHRRGSPGFAPEERTPPDTGRDDARRAPPRASPAPHRLHLGDRGRAIVTYVLYEPDPRLASVALLPGGDPYRSQVDFLCSPSPCRGGGSRSLNVSAYGGILIALPSLSISSGASSPQAQSQREEVRPPVHLATAGFGLGAFVAYLTSHNAMPSCSDVRFPADQSSRSLSPNSLRAAILLRCGHSADLRVPGAAGRAPNWQEVLTPASVALATVGDHRDGPVRSDSDAHSDPFSMLALAIPVVAVLRGVHPHRKGCWAGQAGARTRT